MEALPSGSDVWAAYIRATMRGYHGGYGDFSDQYYDQYWDYQFSGGGGGIAGGSGPSSMSFTYTTKTSSYGELIEIPGYKPIREVIITLERHTVTLNFGNTITQNSVSSQERGGYNVDNAVNWLNGNSHPTYADAKAAGDGASCARFIRYSLEAGLGLKRDALLGKTPVPARQYGSFLIGMGFSPVNTSNYLRGDIIVFQGYPGGTSDANGIPYGHIQMYNGTQWLSNFKQNNFWPGSGYRTYQPSFEIYRWGYYP